MNNDLQSQDIVCMNECTSLTEDNDKGLEPNKHELNAALLKVFGGSKD